MHTIEKLARAREGDAKARAELVEENLKLVHYVLKRFRDRGAEYEDLYQYGCMGLLKAIDRFDPSYGARFSTYAVPVIMGEIRRYLRDDGSLHISRSIHDNALRIEKFREEYCAAHQSEPTIREIAAATGIEAEEVMLSINARRSVRSLDEQVGEGEGMRLMDVIGEDRREEIDRRLLLAALLKELKPEERSLIIRRYFRSQTQSEIAGEMGISQVQVSRMEGKIIRRMRMRAEGE